MQKIYITTSILLFLSGCIDSPSAVGALAGLTGNPPPRYTPVSSPSILDSYYERQARDADRATLRQQRNSTMCRVNSTLPLC